MSFNVQNSTTQVPPALVLTAETARQQSRLGDLMEAHGLPEWSALALYLLELSRNDGRGREKLEAAADWAPWLRTLPRQTGCVLEWSQDEARALHLAYREALPYGIALCLVVDSPSYCTASSDCFAMLRASMISSMRMCTHRRVSGSTGQSMLFAALHAVVVKVQPVRQHRWTGFYEAPGCSRGPTASATQRRRLGRNSRPLSRTGLRPRCSGRTQSQRTT